MISAVIVDDEELARRGLELRLEQYEQFDICALCNNGREAIRRIVELKPDVVFLDIQMPGTNGLEVVKAISGSDMPLIVFVTAFDHFAVKAFEAHALDYLLKPINDVRFNQLVNKLHTAQLSKRQATTQNKLLEMVCQLSGRELTLEQALAKQSAQHQFVQYLMVDQCGHKLRLDVNRVDWIEAAGDYICLHADEQTYVLRDTMKHVEAILNPAMFCRIHRSTIINMSKVTSVRRHRNGECFVLICEYKEFKVSRKYKNSFATLLELDVNTLNSIH